jgi:hypothetical protein
VRDLSKPLAPSYGNPKKERLAKKADKAHDRAVKKGKTQVGTRRVLNYSNPRDLGGGTSTVPVYKREKKIRDKMSSVKTKTPKGPKQHWTGRLKTALTRTGNGKPRKSKADKAACKYKRKSGRARNRRKHSSCKA